jgi:hypothetical protein
MARNYMLAYHPQRVYEVYSCPEYPKGTHYHIRDHFKRVQKGSTEYESL